MDSSAKGRIVVRKCQHLKSFAKPRKPVYIPVQTVDRPVTKRIRSFLCLLWELKRVLGASTKVRKQEQNLPENIRNSPYKSIVFSSEGSVAKPKAGVVLHH